ncbi:MAG: hypothetical protein GPOALKHO_000318 [Sodalis sp.]|nr:MAG: hypothetical protein GPOALKHO_000318 [Sodalis sp.]
MIAIGDIIIGTGLFVIFATISLSGPGARCFRMHLFDGVFLMSSLGGFEVFPLGAGASVYFVSADYAWEKLSGTLVQSIDYNGFISTYIGIPLFPLIWLGCRWRSSSRLVRYEDMTFFDS